MLLNDENAQKTKESYGQNVCEDTPDHIEAVDDSTDID